MTFLVYWTSKNGSIDLDDVGTFRSREQAQAHVNKELESKEEQEQIEAVEIIEANY